MLRQHAPAEWVYFYKRVGAEPASSRQPQVEGANPRKKAQDRKHLISFC